MSKHQEMLDRGEEAKVETTRLIAEYQQRGGRVRPCVTGHRTILKLKFNSK